MTAAIFIYYTPDWQSLADLVLPRVYAYCLKHGYASEIHCYPNMGCVGAYKMHTLALILHKYDAIWVLDLDTIITNPEIKFTDFINGNYDIFITQDIHGINAGSWIVRNTPASNKFIAAVLNDFDAPEEQTVMKRYLDMVCVKYLPHPSINSYEYELYKDEIGEREMKAEDGEWNVDCLLLHLPGISYEKRLEIIKLMI